MAVKSARWKSNRQSFLCRSQEGRGKMNSFLVSLFGSRTATPLSSPPKVVESKSSEPIVAYRLWQLRDGDLYSVTVVHARWPRFVPMRMNEASLGIHAAKDLGRLVHEGYDFDVAGSVYLWGKVSEHEDGYTAEFAYPKTLFLPSKTDLVKVMELEDNYGVPCQFRDEFFPEPQFMGIGQINLLSYLASFQLTPQIMATMQIQRTTGVSSGLTDPLSRLTRWPNPR